MVPDPRRVVDACRGLSRPANSAAADEAAVDDGAVLALAERLLAAWGADSRGYHDTEHLVEVLARLDELACTAPTVELAAWFHDAVYTGATDGADERASAAMARTELTELGLPTAAADRVAELVAVTVDHVPAAGDTEAAMLCDADLAILAADPARYQRYVAGVRRDFAHVPDAAFAAGRAAILLRLLQRTETDPGPDGPLFRSPGTSSWTRAAAANLTRELAALTAAG